MKKLILCILLASATLLFACGKQNGQKPDNVSISSSAGSEDVSSNVSEMNNRNDIFEAITEEEKLSIAEFFSLPLSAGFLEDNYDASNHADVNVIFYNGYSKTEVTDDERTAYYEDWSNSNREDTGIPLVKVDEEEMNRLLVERTGYDYDSMYSYFSGEDHWVHLSEYNAYYKEKQENLPGKVYEVVSGITNGEEYIVRVSPSYVSKEDDGYKKIDKSVVLKKVGNTFQYDSCTELLDDNLLKEYCYSFVAMSQGREQFYTYRPMDGDCNASFALVCDGELFQMLEAPDNNYLGDKLFVGITDICFNDYDCDGCTDVVVIIQYNLDGSDVFEQRVYRGSDDGRMEYEPELSGFDNIVDAQWKMSSISGCAEDSSGWRTAMIEFLEYNDYYQTQYDFVYTRAGSKVYPEIAAIGDCEATGSAIITYGYDGAWVTMFDRLGFYYIPGEGLFNNSDGIMGSYFDYVYRLNDSGMLEMIASGAYEGLGEIDELDYYWNNEPSSKEEYDRKLSAAFPMDNAVYGYKWNKTISFSELMDLLYLKVDSAF